MTFSDINWGQFLCGLGLFLFGVVYMGDGLKSFAGDKLRSFIDKYTSKPWQGIIVGALMTAIIQSSSATSAITIGFVRSGLMTLEQAAGIIIGANIGSTMTSFLIGLNVEGLSVYFVIIGALILMFSKKKKVTDVAKILFGFGCLFFGISLISTTLSCLKDIPEFTELAKLCAENPFIGLAIGIVMTCAMQSSAAAIGIIQVLYEAGAISFQAVIPFLFGSNIGTCITAIMAAMGGNVASKRTALIHLLFNVFGTILGMCLITPINNIVSNLNSIAPMMQIALVHIVFNVVTAILVSPFIKQLCNLTRVLIKGDEPKKLTIETDNVDPKSFKVASLAFEVSHGGIVQMKDLVKQNIDLAAKIFSETGTNADDIELSAQNEELINQLDKSITKFILGIPTNKLSAESAFVKNVHLNTIKNLERVGDLVENVVDFVKMVAEGKERFTDEAYKEVANMFDAIDKELDETFMYFDDKKIERYSKILGLEAKTDLYEKEYMQNHFTRMSNGECNSAIASSVYSDLISNLERIADHICNIAKQTFERANL